MINKKLTITIIVFFIISLLIGQCVFATDIEEEIDKNLFLYGKEVIINEIITGDVFVITNKLEINGEIYGNVFAIADEIVINGDIGLDIYCICNTLTIGQTGDVYRDVNSISKNLNVMGIIEREVNSRVENDFVLGAKARILGDLNVYLNQSNSNLENTERVKGNINIKEINKTEVKDRLIDLLKVIVYSIVIWIILKIFIPTLSIKNKVIEPKRIILGFVLGIVTLITIPIIAVLCIYTKIGALFGIGLLGLCLLIISIAGVVFAICVSELVSKLFKQPSLSNNIIIVLAIIIGIWCIQLIPNSTLLVTGIVTLIGTGLFFTSLISRQGDEEKVVVKSKSKH